MKIETSHEVTIPSLVTGPYLSMLFLKQTKNYTASQLAYTYLLKSEFINVMHETPLGPNEVKELNMWVEFIFCDEQQVPLSLVVHRSKFLLNIPN